MQQRNRALELGLLVACLAALSRFLNGVPLAAFMTLTVFTAVAGTAWLRGEYSPLAWRLDRLVLPGLAAFAAVGTGQLLDAFPWLAAVVVGALVAATWSVSIESEPKDDLPDGSHARPVAARLGAFGLAFLGFAAVGGVLPGAVPDGRPFEALPFLGALALEVLIGGLAGYRIAAVRPHQPGQVAVAFYQYAMVLAPVGVVVRVLALPRLFGPALLVLATYLVTSLRESEEPIRFNVRLLEETFALLVAGGVVIVLGILVR